MPATALRSVHIRSRIAGILELVIAAWAVLRFTHARAVASVAAEAADAATSGGATFQLLWNLFSIATPLIVGIWLLMRGPTWVIDKLMVVSLVASVWFFGTSLHQSLGSPAALAGSTASVVMAFVCWKLTRDDLALLAAAAVVGVGVAAVALVEALGNEQDLGVGGWVDSDGAPLVVVAEPAPDRARLLARDDMGGWFELPHLDAETGVATVDLPRGRWYLALQSPAPLAVRTTLRVLRDAPAVALDDVAPLAA